jgi:hypothetical protein
MDVVLTRLPGVAYHLKRKIRENPQNGVRYLMPYKMGGIVLNTANSG